MLISLIEQSKSNIMGKYFFIACLLITLSSFAQDEICGTETEMIKASAMNFSRDNEKILIVPVIFHVLYKSDSENIDESLITAALNTLNNDFLLENNIDNVPDNFKKNIANPKIEFVAAASAPNGYIIRKATTTRIFDFRKRQAFKESPAYDTERYLNVYICATNTGAYTPGPGISEYHGIVIHYKNVNGTSRTLTHEAGHWLGLPHLFDKLLCVDGDGIADTPKQRKVSGCAQQTHCNGPIMINNFMGYGFTDDIDCRSFFTKGQVMVMREFALSRKKFESRDSSTVDAQTPSPSGTGVDRFPENRIGNNAYIDAQKLVTLTKMSLLSGGVTKINTDTQAILTSYGITNKNNPFFTEFFKEVTYSSRDGAADISTDALNRNLKASRPNDMAAVNWQASALNGLASFMAGRFKQELLHTGINQIFKKIVDTEGLSGEEQTKAQLVADFFPKTTEQIKLLYNGGNAAYYSADIVFLSQTAKTDVQEIPLRLLKRPEILLSKLDASPKVHDVVIIATRIFEHTGNGLVLPKIIESLAIPNYKDPHIKNMTRLAAMISNGLRAPQDMGSLWINPIKQNPEDVLTNDAVCYFYGLMYAQLSNIPVIKAYLDQNGDLKIIAGKIQKLLLMANELNKTYDYIKSKDFDLKTTEEKIHYVRSINESFMVFATALTEIPQINSTFGLTNKILKTSGDFINIIELFLEKDYVLAINQLTIQLNEYTIQNGAYNRVLVFASQLATIESSEDMEELLQAYAAPIGSSSTKRSSPFSITLNSYVGLNTGSETVHIPGENEEGYYWGLTAPVGFAFSFKPVNDMKGSVSIFATILDLGSLVNVRLENDDTSYNDLRFEHFLTPGLGLSYNFNNIPLTVGIYGSYITNLREIKYLDEGATEILGGRNVTRFNVSLLIDIPLLTIYNKKEK